MALYQYIVVRKDLLKGGLGWPLGSVIAQGCHAATAVLAKHRDDPAVLEYTSPANLPSMHKVVLQIKDEAGLVALSAELTSRQIDHHVWHEQPEDIATALATKPCTREQLGDALRSLPLYR